MSTNAMPHSNTWLQEFAPYVNGQRVRWPDLALNLLDNDECTLTLDYEYSWLIGDPDAFITMRYQSGQEGQGLVFDPPLGQLIEMAEDTTSLSWTIRTNGAPSGAFKLEFALPLLPELPVSPTVPGKIVNLAQELEIKFDESDVAFGGGAFPCLGAKHTLTVRPKPSSTLLDKPVKLIWGREPGADLAVTIAPALGKEELLTLEGKTWELDCLHSNESGDFSLQLMLVEWGVTSSPLTLSLGHNLVTVERWTTPEFQWPDINWTQRHIRATSVFSGKRAERVPVNKAGSNQIYKRTNLLGEAATDIASQGGGQLEILNRYDGTIV